MSENTAVYTPTKESYDRLMKAYEKKGWKRIGGQNPTDVGYEKEYEDISFMDGFFSCNNPPPPYVMTATKHNFITSGYTIITVEEALARLGQYERGQEVLVSDNNRTWEKRKLLAILEGIGSDNSPIIVQRDGYKNDREPYKYIKPLEEPIKEMTMQEVETALGHKVKIIK